jgi:hypothetical protein
MQMMMLLLMMMMMRALREGGVIRQGTTIRTSTINRSCSDMGGRGILQIPLSALSGLRRTLWGQ